MSMCVYLFLNKHLPQKLKQNYKMHLLTEVALQPSVKAETHCLDATSNSELLCNSESCAEAGDLSPFCKRGPMWQGLARPDECWAPGRGKSVTSTTER